ncbi:Glyoxalase-like domain protein [Maioricimonas rarisocia]|uniref:Glyoxalase-like domain protein n=1 Tax=Maioricimonas rarisocia TaxID=2528026 RepID=A0A517Z3A5_9PLAN|nr:VOC family protein [Maioricimonas rarisocia]QDU36974.1 Glyoxalase-like domain protein [Maioricimonas rarisocia]
MTSQLGRFTLLVRNYEQAIDFYSRLGFEVIHDTPGPPHRFVHLGMPGQSPVGLWLWEATDEQADLVGRQSGGHPLLVIYTPDCRAEYERLGAAGVEMKSEPVAEGSSTYFHVIDPYGNVIVIVEMKEG